MINLCDYLTGNDEFQVKKYGWICYHIYLSTFSTTQERLHHGFGLHFQQGYLAMQHHPEASGTKLTTICKCHKITKGSNSGLHRNQIFLFY